MARKKRECDVVNSSSELVKAFVEHCNYCEQGCPMGCIHRRGEIIGLLDWDSWKCGNILQCFAQFALSEDIRNRPKVY